MQGDLKSGVGVGNQLGLGTGEGFTKQLSLMGKEQHGHYGESLGTELSASR